jgi:acyl dehydratase
MSEFTLANVKEWVGREIGVSEWLLVDQARIDQFAECTGDHQWIHVDVERAKRESPFRTPVAHGYLTLSLIGSLAQQIGVVPSDAAAGFNYGIDKARFLAPVPAGTRVRLRAAVDGVEEERWANTSEDKGRSRNREQRQAGPIAETLALLVTTKPTK